MTVNGKTSRNLSYKNIDKTVELRVIILCYINLPNVSLFNIKLMVCIKCVFLIFGTRNNKINIFIKNILANR